VRPCMHQNYDVISGSHACRDWVWYATCAGQGRC